MSKRRRQQPGNAAPQPLRVSANGHGGTPNKSGIPIIGGGGGGRAGGSLSPTAARRLLFVLLAVSLVLSLLFAARLPLDANPDEKDHLNYVRLLVEERGFVQFRVGDPARYQTHQPPAYYLLAAPVYALTGGNLLALRLINIALHLLTITVAFRAGRDLFPDRAEIAVGAAAFVAFLPVQAQLAGAVTNDPLTTLICAVIFWRLGLLVTQGQDLRGALLLGVLFGAGLLTKFSVLQLVPAMLAAYAIAAWAKTLPFSRAVAQAALVLALGVVIASPWLVRNTLLYGDPLTVRIYRQTGPNFTPQQMMALTGWSSLGEYLSNAATRTYATFWYFLPPNVILPTRFAPFPLLLTAVMGFGGLLGTLRRMGQTAADETQTRRVLALYVLGIFLLVPFFTMFILTTFQAQGRYFLPALLPAAITACAGWATLVSGTASTGHARIIGALVPPLTLLVMTLYALGGGAFHR